MAGPSSHHAFGLVNPLPVDWRVGVRLAGAWIVRANCWPASQGGDIPPVLASTRPYPAWVLKMEEYRSSSAKDHRNGLVELEQVGTVVAGDGIGGQTKARRPSLLVDAQSVPHGLRGPLDER
jgi:hypothetical protein